MMWFTQKQVVELGYTAAFISLHTVTNKPYVNEVTLTGQNPPLKCC